MDGERRDLGLARVGKRCLRVDDLKIVADARPKAVTRHLQLAFGQTETSISSVHLRFSCAQIGEGESHLLFDLPTQALQFKFRLPLPALAATTTRPRVSPPLKIGTFN